MTWTFRFLAYCRDNGKTPEEMLAADRARYPGGKMAGFISWISAKWEEFAKVHPHNRDYRTERDHAAFDAWLGGSR